MILFKLFITYTSVFFSVVVPLRNTLTDHVDDEDYCCDDVMMNDTTVWCWWWRYLWPFNGNGDDDDDVDDHDDVPTPLYLVAFGSLPCLAHTCSCDMKSTSCIDLSVTELGPRPSSRPRVLLKAPTLQEMEEMNIFEVTGNTRWPWQMKKIKAIVQSLSTNSPVQDYRVLTVEIKSRQFGTV